MIRGSYLILPDHILTQMTIPYSKGTIPYCTLWYLVHSMGGSKGLLSGRGIPIRGSNLNLHITLPPMTISIPYSKWPYHTMPDILHGSKRLLPGIKESRSEDHDCFAGALFQLEFDGRELLADDADHAVDLLRGDRSRTALLPQQVHHVRRKLSACLKC